MQQRKTSLTLSKRTFLSSVRIRNKGAERESKREGVSVAHRVGSNLSEENMNEILPTALDFIDRIECKFNQAGLLTYPDFVVWKGLETSLDVQQLRSGLI